MNETEEKTATKPFFRAQKKGFVLTPENLFDDLPAKSRNLLPNGSDDVPGPLKNTISVSDLLESPERYGDVIVASLHEHGFFVVNMDDIHMKLLENIYTESAKFFACRPDEMKEYEIPAIDKNFPGYHRIYFENHDTRRLPELRDVFEFHLGLQDQTKFPSDALRNLCRDGFYVNWRIAIATLRALAHGLGVSEEALLQIVRPTISESEDGAPIEASENKSSNFCLFHYYDALSEYESPQRCMVHQDTALVTVLPKATLPGIEVADNQRSHWIPAEEYTEDNQFLVYTGEMMEYITSGYVGALVHRVVREPKMTRYSAPFELRPDRDATLTVIEGSRLIEEYKKGDKEKYSRENGEISASALQNAGPNCVLTICDNCGLQIPDSERYKCRNCANYDHCAKCHGKETRHPKDHEFYLVDVKSPHQKFPEKRCSVDVFYDRVQIRRRIKKVWRLMQLT